MSDGRYLGGDGDNSESNAGTPDISARTSVQRTFFHFSLYEVGNSPGLRYVAPYDEVWDPFDAGLQKHNEYLNDTEENGSRRIYAGLP